MRGLAAGAAVVLIGCGVTPLSNRIDVGNEAFVVVAGEGADGNTDLFAAPAEGGTFRQLTYSRVAEDLPRLGPTGTRLAFVRSRGEAIAAGEPAMAVVVMNLSNGTEIEGTLPPESAPVSRLGWTAAGDTLIAAAGGDRWVAAVDGGLRWTKAGAAAGPALDSLLSERVGDPPFGTIQGCSSGAGACVVTARGEETALDPRGTDQCRWGPDALGYVVDGRIEIRPLGGGRIRQPTWIATPAKPRRPTHHPGSGAR